MKSKAARLSAFALFGFACVARSDDLTWYGVNNEAATSILQTNTDDPALWHNTSGVGDRVPVAGDRALVVFNDVATTGPDQYVDELLIKPGTTFAPDSIRFYSGDWNTPHVPAIQLKDLTLVQFDAVCGGSSGGLGDNKWQIGSPGSGGWLLSRNMDPTYGSGVTGTIKITGPLGSATTADLTGMTLNQVITEIDSYSAATGVDASLWTAYRDQRVKLEGTPVGTAGFVEVSEVSGIFPTSRYYNSPLTRGDGWAPATVTLTLTGTNPVTYAGSTGGSMMFGLYNGSKMVLNNANIRLRQPGQTPWNAVGSAGIRGTDCDIEFPAVGGAVTLESAGVRGQGTMGLGANQLRVRSDQVWSNPTGTGFFRQGMYPNRLAEAIDALPLVNMGSVPFVVDARNANDTKDVEAGEYQSIHLLGGSASAYTSTLRLLGNVRLRGPAVHPGANTTVAASLDPEYGLILNTSQRIMYNLNLNGFTLTVDHGVKLASSTPDISGTYHNETTRNRQIDARGASLVIHGDLEFSSSQQYAGNVHSNTPPAASLDQYTETRLKGILANAATVITLGGSFKSNVRSRATDAWDETTVNLLGGSVSTGNTFEVGCDGVAGHDGDVDRFADGTYTIGVLNVGDGSTAGFVTLVNDSLNDGDNGLTSPLTQPPKNKDDEILMAKRLNIKAGSRLDCNGLGVAVSSNGLSIASDATLDLHSGGTLVGPATLTRFHGAGDQTVSWNDAKASVKDSTNPDFSFRAVYEAGPNLTYWQAYRTPAKATVILCR